MHCEAIRVSRKFSPRRSRKLCIKRGLWPPIVTRVHTRNRIAEDCFGETPKVRTGLALRPRRACSPASLRLQRVIQRSFQIEFFDPGLQRRIIQSVDHALIFHQLKNLPACDQLHYLPIIP